jgi:uncharacterized membrane protein YhiD involved in acid resistance
MDELKLLIEMVSNLPSLAVWVLVGYLFYKIAVVGSIYGLLRFGIEKLHDWLVTRKTRTEEVSLALEGRIIATNREEFLAQLRRMTNILNGGPSPYIHSDTTAWLRAAIDDKIAKDQAAAKK